MTEDGERELVLGNKQLLAIFFVAALLCGVFFAMGYVVGGNSAKSAATVASATDSTPAPSADGKREEPQDQPLADSAGAPGASGASGDSAALPATEPQVADNPAAAGSRPPADQVPPPEQPAPRASAPAAPPASADTGVSVSVPAAGASYLQVAALGRPAADELVVTLRKRELPAILAASPKPEFFRVLVGPYRSTLSLKDAKDKLKTLGFDNLIVHKP